MKNYIFSKNALLLYVASLIFPFTVLHAQVCNGSVTLSSQAQVNAFNCTSITGDLIISGPDITDLSPLLNLTSVGGSLEVYDNNVLTNVNGLSGITLLGMDIEIYKNDALTNLDGLSGITALPGRLYIWYNNALINLNGLLGVTSIGGELTLSDNDILTNVDGFASITSVGGQLSISYNDLLTNLDGLSGITYIGGELWIGVNDALSNVDGLSGLTNIGGSLVISQNDLLSNLDGLSGVITIGEHLVISYNDLLTNLEGLAGITSVGKNLRVEFNTALANVNGLAGINFVGEGLSIRNNDVLINLDGLNGITAVSDLVIWENNALLNLDGLSGITTIRWTVTIVKNPLLTNLDGLSGINEVGLNLIIRLNNLLTNVNGLSGVTAVGDVLHIWENDVLENVDGLSGITAVGGALEIYQNDALTNLDGLSGVTSVGGDLKIINNKSPTNLDGLSGIVSVGGNLGIKDNILLDEFCGLYPLIGGGGLEGTSTITGNAQNPTQQQIIDDCNTQPVAQCQDVNKEADNNCEADVSPDEIDNGSFDPDGDEITLSLSPEGPYGTGVTAVTLTVMDNNGKSDQCTANITVTDNTSPNMICPADIIVNNDPGQCGAVVNFTATATDNCPGVSVVSNPPAGSYFNKSSTTVNCIATDASGNQDTCSFSVTVNDNEDPSISCPADITVNNEPGQCGAVVNFNVTATDNCPGLSVSTSPSSGSFFAMGTTLVTAIATDESGNSTQCSFNVTVIDNEIPAIVCPEDIYFELCGLDTTLNILQPVINENCDFTLTNSYTGTDDASSIYSIGVTEILWTVTDASNNSNSCTQTIDLQAVHLPESWAGNDTSIIPGEVYPLSEATAAFYSSIQWETAGDGFFSNGLITNPTYTPGENDKQTGSVDLNISLQGLNSCGFSDSDQMTLTIFRPPSIDILQPLEGNVYYDYQLHVYGIASDPDNDLASVYARINGGGWQLATGTANWQTDLPVVFGNNLIEAKSVDAQGLESDLDAVPIFAGVQEIAFGEGWNHISAYLTPLDPDLETILQDPVNANLITILNDMHGGIYWPSQNLNTIGQWNSQEAYQAKLTGASAMLFSGELLDDQTLDLESGFTYLPVLTNVSSPIDDVFENPTEDVKLIFNHETVQIYWPYGGIFTLQELQPGMGYLALFNNPATATFPPYDMDAMQTKASGISQPEDGPWPLVRTNQVHMISVSVEAIAELSAGTYIGAFDENGRCIGYTEIDTSEENSLLVVYGDESYTQPKDGALEGETIYFRSWSAATGEENDLTPVYNNRMPNSDGLFANNGLSMITGFKVSSTGIGEGLTQLSVQLFPNPARESVTLVCPDYTSEGQFEAEFVNANGELIEKVQLSGQSTNISLDRFTRGVYFVKITSQTATLIEKLVIQ